MNDRTMAAEFAEPSPQSNRYMHKIGIAYWILHPGGISALAKRIRYRDTNFP
jgi:hypothetical protein